jgi:integrase
MGNGDNSRSEGALMPSKFETTKHTGVYKRGESYYFSFNVDGRTIKMRAGTKISDAIAAKRETESARDRGQRVVASTAPFLPWALNEWLPSYGGRTGQMISERTRHEYERELRKWATPFFGSTRLSHMTRPLIKQYIAHLQKPEHTLADSTVRRILAPLTAALADAADDGLIASNPAAGVKVPSRRQIVEGDDEVVKALSTDELARLVAVIDPRWQLLIELLAATGLRINEALALRWRDIALGSTPSLRVVRAIKKNQQEKIGPPKSRAGRRTVPLPSSLAMALRLRRAEAEWSEADDLVFPSSTGTAMSDNNLRSRVLAPAAKAAGVPWIGFHTLRHTCATLLFAQGRNIRQVSAWLGHADPSFTLRTYVGLLDGDVGGPLDLDAVLAREPIAEAIGA